MKKTIQGRITVILIAAIGMVVLMGGLSLYYIGRFSSHLDQAVESDLSVLRATQKMKAGLFQIRRAEKNYLDLVDSREMNLRETLYLELKEAVVVLKKNIDEGSNLVHLIANEQDWKKLNENVHEYDVHISSIDLQMAFSKPDLWRKSVNDLFMKKRQIEVMVNFFMESAYQQLDIHQSQMDVLLSNARRNMLFFLLVICVGGILLVVFAPSRVTAPFHRYISAISEIEDLNLDVRLPIRGDDEVARLGKAINRMVDRFRTFDEIKLKKIQFEKRQQKVLANMLDQGVMILSKEGKILSVNAQLSKVLGLETDDYQNKDFHRVSISQELKEMMEAVLREQRRVDSRMMILNYRVKTEKGKQAEEALLEVLVDVALVRTYEGELVNYIFTFEDITSAVGTSVFKRLSTADQSSLSAAS